MKTLTIHASPIGREISGCFASLRRGVLTSGLVAQLGAAAFVAGTLVLATWAVGSGDHEMLAALSWMAGIVLAAMAIDGSGARAAWQALSAPALMGLAWMCSRIAPEFGLLAALLVSAWAADALLRSALRR